MGLRSQQSVLDNDFVLEVHLDNVKNISLLLKAVHFNDSATFIATEKGIKVTVEDSKCVEAQAFIQAEVFQRFILREEQIIFRLHLKSLLECLNIFGSMTSTALKMCYQGYGYPLKLLLEEGGVVTDCSIKTQDPLDGMNLTVDTEELNKVIVKGECLRDILSDLDATSELVEIRLAPTEPRFHLATSGASGLMQIDVPNTSDVIESFHCPRESTFKYKYAHIKPLLKIVAVAQKVSLLTDQVGLLGCQTMVSVPPHTCYIEYYCAPVVDDEYNAELFNESQRSGI